MSQGTSSVGGIVRIGMSHLYSKDGNDILMWNGMRWLSGDNNPPNCSALCTTDTVRLKLVRALRARVTQCLVRMQGSCKQPPDYHPGTDFDYWIPLDFDEHGTVQQFADFVDEFDLDL